MFLSRVISTCKPGTRRVGLTLASASKDDFKSVPTKKAIVVDLDDTVVIRGLLDFFWLYLTRTGAGGTFYPNVASVIKELQRQHHIIALTARWDYCARNTLSTLAQEGINVPVVLSSSPLFNGKQRYTFKAAALTELRSRGFDLVLGVGDRWSDYEAYKQHGMLSIIIQPQTSVERLCKERRSDPDLIVLSNQDPSIVWPGVYKHIQMKLKDFTRTM